MGFILLLMKNSLTIFLIIGLLLGISTVMADTEITDEQSLAFRIEIVKDWTIAVPALCEDADNTIDGTLEFSPSIEGVWTDGSRPDDGCGDANLGDYNVTNEGNVPIDLNFRLNDTAPQGVTIALGNNLTYAEIGDHSYFNLTTGDQNPSWGQSISATGSDTVQIWQRVGANDTAIGGDSYMRQMVITSSDAS